MNLSDQPTELLESQDITYYFQKQKAHRLVKVPSEDRNQQAIVPHDGFATSVLNQPATSNGVKITNPGEAEELGFEVIEHDYKESNLGNAIITTNDLDGTLKIITLQPRLQAEI
ncbi:hypothetical protein HGRIS_001186 [Hohenbuehelia grisea]|uniref:Uncharacterized protein n=1 Tax=Hohenbuehelia grisea TaxID=104357 RepID=A0ABR3JQF6_9AGAR